MGMPHLLCALSKDIVTMVYKELHRIVLSSALQEWNDVYQCYLYYGSFICNSYEIYRIIKNGKMCLINTGVTRIR